MTRGHRTALNHALRVVDLRLRELGVPTADDRHGDPIDLQVAQEAHESHVLGVAGLTERRRLILAALAKVGTPEAGRCEDCGAVIPGKRLAVLPWATRCLLCEARAEQIASRAMAPWLPQPMLEDDAL
jgi:RNA polymerase-binding transcription factor DksA